MKESFRPPCLNLSNSGTTEIPILESTVSELRIDNNKVSRLDNLPPALRKLSCKNNKIYEVGNLCLMSPSIEFLDLTENKLASLDGIGSLPYLDTLLLGSNYLHAATFDCLLNLQSLRVLDLSNNNIRISDNSEGLQSLPSIQYLYLNGNELTAWTIGGNTRKLKELRIDNNQLKALEFVGSKGTLETLSAKNNCLESVESIVELTSLKELYLDHNGIKGFATINSCTSLRILSLTNNKIAELPKLKLTRLEELYLSNNQLTSMQFVEDLENLVELHIAANTISEVPPLPELVRLEVLDISHNRLKTAENLAFLKNLNDLNISFNLIKSQEFLCEELFKLTALAKVDTRQNLFNAIPLDQGDIDQYRYALIYNLSQTLTIIDGTAVTNDERANTFHYYSQQPISDHLKNTRLFKLTETLDTQILKIHEIIDSSRKEISRHEMLRESQFGTMPQSSVESVPQGRSGEKLTPELRPMSVYDIRQRSGKSSVSKIKKSFMDNIKEFDTALNEFKEKSRTAFTSLRDSSKGFKSRVEQEAKNFSENLPSQEPIPTPPQEFVHALSEQDQNIPPPNDDSVELADALDIRKQQCNVADNTMLRPEDSITQEKGRFSKITGEFRKVFREELDALRSDLREKLDRYRESKNLSMRTMDYTRPEELAESRTMIYSIHQRCEDNEKKLQRMRSKMHKLVKVIKKDKENESLQKQELNKSIAVLRQKVESIESRDRSFRSSSVLREKPAFHVNVQTDNDADQGADTSYIKEKIEPLSERAVKDVFEKHAKGNRAIPSQYLNALVKELVAILDKHRIQKTVPDIIVNITKTAAKCGYITLDMLLIECGIKGNKKSRTQSMSRISCVPVKRNTKAEEAEQRYMEKLQRAIYKELEKGSKNDMLDRIITKLFSLNKCKVEKIFEIKQKKEVKEFFTGKIRTQEARVFFHAGNYQTQNTLVEKGRGIDIKELVFTPSLAVALKRRKKDQQKVLVAIAYLSKCGKVTGKTKKVLFGDEIGSLYDANDKTYAMRSVNQVCPLYIINYYSS